MDEFFRHENQVAVPTLLDMGDVRHCTKSDLMGCAERLITAPQNGMPEVDEKLSMGLWL